MCGIAGILGLQNPANRAALHRMADAMAHRGPDGEGFWEGTPDAAGAGCMLAHRRLSILDLTNHASQPMVDLPSGKVIVFNGEIYNFRQLRSDLAARGEQFTSSGDTAVLLRALALDGYRALEQLRGMFAFAIWDDALRQLILARDPLGIKPLYICHNPDAQSSEWSLIFASEVRALLASGLIRQPRLSAAAVASVVWNGFVAGPATIVEQISSLMPGEAKTMGSDGRETRASFFWQMPRSQSGPPESEEQFAEVLSESVNLHMVSDVPLGIFLSSGVDSSAVANLAQKSSGQRVQTFTLGFEEPEWNEGNHARQIAQAIGTDHHEIVLTEAQFVAHLESAIDSLDQPTFDGLNSYYISRAVREAGLKVALIGTGGDELFGGYTSFRHLPRLQQLSQSTSWVPDAVKVSAARAFAGVTQRSSAAVAPQTRWAKLPGMVERGADLLALYQLSYALFLPKFQQELLSAPRAAGNLSHGLSGVMHKRLTEEIAGQSPLKALTILELRCFLGERLLPDTDAASMAVSLEVRLPLVDSVLLERLNRVPDRERYEPVGRKAMLRRIGLRGLDPRLFERPKRGFVMPFEKWIGGNLGKTMNDVMRDSSAAASVGLNGGAVSRLWQAYQDRAKGMYWSRVWAIYILIRWCHRHGVLV